MFTYNFFCTVYNLLRNRKYIPIRFFSPFRFIWRRLSNFILPAILNSSTKYNNLVASDFLRPLGIEKLCIVSFTSFPRRIANVWQVIECLKRQSIRPDKILLYLSQEQFHTLKDVPESITSRIDEVFEVRIVEGDLRSFKKFYYSFNEFSDDIVILVDDDIYYPINMIENMLKAYVENQQMVICRYGSKIQFDYQDNIKKYSDWKPLQKSTDSENIFLGTGGGSLFHPKSLYKDILNKNLFNELCPLADDIWINAMVRLSGIKIKKIKDELLLPIITKNNETLCKVNVSEGQNDIQIKAVDDYYYRTLGKRIFNNRI